MGVEETNVDRHKMALKLMAQTLAACELLMELEARRRADDSRPSTREQFEQQYLFELNQIRKRQQEILEGVWEDERIAGLTGERCPLVHDEALENPQQ